MTLDLATTLIPLVIGTALVPIPLILTALLLRSPVGRGPAVALVAGMMAVRLAQGLVFGLLLGGLIASGGERGPVLYGGLVVLALVFLVSGVRKAIDAPDDDAPPPRWLSRLDGIGASRAFVIGAGLLAIGVKHWVFTLGAIAAIADAELGPGPSAAVFIAFVVLAHALQVGLLALAFLAPDRAGVVLDRFANLLGRHSRPLLAGVSLVFGAWFLVKGLSGLGFL